jgi:hypothetical protein
LAPSLWHRCHPHSPSATRRPSSCSPPPSTPPTAPPPQHVQANYCRLSINGNDAAIAQSSQLVRQATEALDKCPSGTYFVVRQEGVSSADYLDELSAPHLSHYLGGNNGIKSAMSVTEAVGGVDAGTISQHLQTKCGAEVMHVSLSSKPAPSQAGVHRLTTTSETDVLPRSSYAAEQLVVYLTLPTPPTSDRSTALRQHGKSILAGSRLLSNLI